MANDVMTHAEAAPHSAGLPADTAQVLAVRVGSRLCGLPLARVHDIVTVGAIAPIPRAPAHVAGAVNLRERFVTAIDIRRAAGLAGWIAAPGRRRRLGVTAESGGVLYLLLIDSFGDTVMLAPEAKVSLPVWLEAGWRPFTLDAYAQADEVLVRLDVDALIAGA